MAYVMLVLCAAKSMPSFSERLMTVMPGARRTQETPGIGDSTGGLHVIEECAMGRGRRRVGGGGAVSGKGGARHQGLEH